jgi:hypothetical protein
MLAERSSTLFQVMGKAELILPLERPGVAERVYAHYVKRIISCAI